MYLEGQVTYANQLVNSYMADCNKHQAPQLDSSDPKVFLVGNE